MRGLLILVMYSIRCGNSFSGTHRPVLWLALKVTDLRLLPNMRSIPKEEQLLQATKSKSILHSRGSHAVLVGTTSSTRL